MQDKYAVNGQREEGQGQGRADIAVVQLRSAENQLSNSPPHEQADAGVENDRDEGVGSSTPVAAPPVEASSQEQDATSGALQHSQQLGRSQSTDEEPSKNLPD